MLNLTRCLVVVGLVVLTGCNQPITPTNEPIQMNFKVSSGGKPLNDVTLTLQPLEGGQQADIKIAKGEGEAAVVPGKYTYYVEKGKDMAAVEKLPEAFRRGAMDRTVDVSQPTTIELKLD